MKTNHGWWDCSEEEEKTTKRRQNWNWEGGGKRWQEISNLEEWKNYSPWKIMGHDKPSCASQSKIWERKNEKVNTGKCIAFCSISPVYYSYGIWIWAFLKTAQHTSSSCNLLLRLRKSRGTTLLANHHHCKAEPHSAARYLTIWHLGQARSWHPPLHFTTTWFRPSLTSNPDVYNTLQDRELETGKWLWSWVYPYPLPFDFSQHS